MRIAYICDGNGCKSELPSCRFPVGMNQCRHTTDPAHAVNGACEDPVREPDRFVELEPGVFAEIVHESLQSGNKQARRG